MQAETDHVATAIEEEKSVTLLDEAEKSGEIAMGAEEKAVEYQALVLKQTSQSVKDGEALLKTEAGAMVSLCFVN